MTTYHQGNIPQIKSKANMIVLRVYSIGVTVRDKARHPARTSHPYMVKLSEYRIKIPAYVAVKVPAASDELMYQLSDVLPRLVIEKFPEKVKNALKNATHPGHHAKKASDDGSDAAMTEPDDSPEDIDMEAGSNSLLEVDAFITEECDNFVLTGSIKDAMEDAVMDKNTALPEGVHSVGKDSMANAELVHIDLTKDNPTHNSLDKPKFMDESKPVGTNGEEDKIKEAPKDGEPKKDEETPSHDKARPAHHKRHSPSSSGPKNRASRFFAKFSKPDDASEVSSLSDAEVEADTGFTKDCLRSTSGNKNPKRESWVKRTMLKMNMSKEPHSQQTTSIY